ncbi:UPF0565 protein C2orf69 homolog isoform X10 [Portunus trituberculatus]|uniref:UPF0565 protein C2orf69 homolog isoform X10 n=1 Tax=Portunus trituberculatus TaxID=210409 RepID=UPI001E1D0C52|nr:UPF0565 protein C2orf69 homolog isoform X10 [Portunus trituberculatus]
MVPNKVGQLLVGWCLTFARKMSHSTQAVLSPVRLGSITTPSGQANEAIYVQPSKASANLPIAVLVFFGGDVQDYPEVMAAHRDHKNYVDWSLTSTATLLASKFPAHHVLVIKPSRCLQKMREERAKGWIVVPMWTSQPWMGPLLQMLVKAPRLITQKTNVLRHPSSAEEHPIMTHTQLMAYLLSGNNLEGEVYRQKVQRLSWHRGDQVRNMYWLDGGHAGGRNTWITSHSILKSLAAQQQISIHIHVTPYQVLTMPNTHVEQVHNDVGQANPPYNFLAQPTTVMHYTTKVHDEFRPWIGKECKSFYDILKRAGAKIDYLLHFGNESPSLLCHFRILNSFI